MTPTKTNVTDYLVNMAETKTLIVYSELYNHFGIRTGPADDTNPIPLFLGQIMRDNAARGEPLLPSIVVKKEKDVPKTELIPNDMYFTTLSVVRNIVMPRTKADKRRLHQIERDAVFDRSTPAAGQLFEPDGD